MSRTVFTLTRLEPVFLAQLLQLVPDLLGNRREGVLIEHAGDLLPVGRAEDKRGSRQIGIMACAVADLDQQRHLLLWYPSRQFLQIAGRERKVTSHDGVIQFGLPRGLVGSRSQLHRRVLHRCLTVAFEPISPPAQRTKPLPLPEYSRALQTARSIIGAGSKMCRCGYH